MNLLVLKYFRTKQFIKFVLVGGVAAFLHWSSRLVLSIWFDFAISVCLAYGIGVAVAFVLNTIYVFPNSVKTMKLQARDFVIINILFFPVVWLLAMSINSMFEKLGLGVYSESLSHALAIPVPMVVTFLLYKFFAFKDNHDDFYK